MEKSMESYLHVIIVQPNRSNQTGRRIYSTPHSMWTLSSLKVMTYGASLRQDSLRQDSLRHRLAYRVPGFERSCALASVRQERTSAGQEFIENYLIFGIEFSFTRWLLILFMIYNNRHFEIIRYSTHCGLNHNLQTLNNCFRIYKHELFNYDVKSWK